jgi:2-aminoadipate transaminase
MLWPLINQGRHVFSPGSRIYPYAVQYARHARGMVASEIRALFAVAARPEIVSLAEGSPFVFALPLDAVGDMVGMLIASRGRPAVLHGTGCCEAVRADLRGHVTGRRPAHADEVVVTVGSQQALDLITRIFVNQGDVVLAEAPTYRCARRLRRLPGGCGACRHGRCGIVPEALATAIAWLQIQEAFGPVLCRDG